MMVTACPDIPDTGKYSLTDAAQTLGISRASAYQYAQSGQLKYGVRRNNGRRFVTGREIKRFWNAEY